MKKHNCHHCGYYKNGYCNDLDEMIDDPDDPVCSEEYYNS